MNNIWQDLRYGLRMMRRNPGFTAIAVLTLALGIGANTAIFSVADAVVFRPLPYREPDKLISIYETNVKYGSNKMFASPGNYVEWKEQKHLFEQMAGIRGLTVTLTGRDEPEQLEAAYISANFFSTLGVVPFAGRDFLSQEEQPRGGRVVVLSYGLWQRRFGGHSDVIGEVLTLNDDRYTVIGVMPPGFQFPVDKKTELWVPLAFQGRGRNTRVIARLKPEVTLEQAEAGMGALARQLEQKNPALNSGWGVRLISLHADTVGEVRPVLLVLLGTVAFVLMIACVNVANLLLARSATRRKEMAVRAAFGAGRLRLMRQLLTESLLLALFGGLFGLLLAGSAMDFLIAISPVNIPRIEMVGIDGRVFAFTLVTSLLATMIFGIWPALQASKLDLNESLKESGKSSTGGLGRQRVRSLMIVSEVALSLVLLIGAGLLIKSFWRLQGVASGINPANVLTISIILPQSRYPDPSQQAVFYQQVLDRIRALPHTQVASATSNLPLTGGGVGETFTIEGRPSDPSGETLDAGYSVIAPHYFQTMQIPLMAGRDFTDRDSSDAPPVIIISHALSRRYWPNQNPLGQRIKIARGPVREIVGVAEDVRHFGLDAELRAEMYVPCFQADFLPYMNLVVRTTSEPLSVAASVRDQILTVNGDQPVSRIKTMEQYLSDSVAHPRFRSLLIGISAALALLLAAIGLYGVISYSVNQRRREIGIRMALGARPRDVLTLVAGQGMILTLTGVVIGLSASFALTRVIASFLFGVSAYDPATFVFISLLLIVVATVACYIPARRATKVDPMAALRYE